MGMRSTRWSKGVCSLMDWNGNKHLYILPVNHKKLHRVWLATQSKCWSSALLQKSTRNSRKIVGGNSYDWLHSTVKNVPNSVSFKGKFVRLSKGKSHKVDLEYVYNFTVIALFLTVHIKYIITLIDKHTQRRIWIQNRRAPTHWNQSQLEKNVDQWHF